MQEKISKIEVRLEIEYDKEKDSLVKLSELITDIDPAQNNACILVSYESTNTINLYRSFKAPCTEGELKSPKAIRLSQHD
jgi:hypothetical protein